MILYYEDFIDGEWEQIPITILDIKRILDYCQIINIKKKEPFPNGKVTFVGVGNDNYECNTLWDMKYTDHMELTYGGYFNKEHSGHNPWWTMNYNFSDKYDKTKAYIVDNEDDGNKLAKFLNFTHGISNLENTIYDKKEQLNKIQEELSYLYEALNTLKNHE